ncbi:MAG: hypothetical protein ACRDRW_01275 [Pseudonocardiaceae bacterium]
MGQVPKELTPRTHDSGALISKIEKGERFPSLDLTRRLDVALDTDGALERLWPRVDHERATRDAPSDPPASGDGFITGSLGLAWTATPHATVEVVAQLWRSDVDRRSVLVSAAWVASAFAEPMREWLLNREDEVAQGWAARHVAQSDIDALREMCEAFTDVSRRLGGGYTRSTLLHYTNQVVLPLLQGSYNDAIGRELMAATALLCDLCGWMSWDSGRQGLAQRYFIQALRLAQANGNRALGARILADLATQAHSLGDAASALDLASAGPTLGR